MCPLAPAKFFPPPLDLGYRRPIGSPLPGFCLPPDPKGHVTGSRDSNAPSRLRLALKAASVSPATRTWGCHFGRQSLLTRRKPQGSRGAAKTKRIPLKLRAVCARCSLSLPRRGSRVEPGGWRTNPTKGWGQTGRNLNTYLLCTSGREIHLSEGGVQGAGL